MRMVILTLALLLSGCVCNQNLTTRLVKIEQRHGVVIKIKDFSNQSGLCKLLEIIDKDLERCPQYFKDNIGPIFIEKSFDELGSEEMSLVGYVNMTDTQRDYPIHIKNRSALEKILFPVTRENNVFLHEASHSFELNIRDNSSDRWEAFCKEFDNIPSEEHSETVFLSRAFSSEPVSMSNFNSSVNHFEDFAETHCFLRRNNIELIKDKYPVLYKKCRIVERFTAPPTAVVKDTGFSSQSSESTDGGFTPGL